MELTISKGGWVMINLMNDNKRRFALLCFATILFNYKFAFAQVEEVNVQPSYPFGALHETQNDVVNEERKTNSLSRESRITRENLERRKADAERILNAQKIEIQQQKLRQENLSKEINSLKMELQSLEAQFEREKKDLEIVKGQLAAEEKLAFEDREKIESLRKEKSEEIKALARAQEEATKKTQNLQKQMFAWSSEIARLQKEIVDYNDKRVEYESLALKNDEQIQQLESQIADAKSEREQAFASHQLAKSSLEEKQRQVQATGQSLAQVKMERDLAVRNLAQFRSSYQAEMKRLEDRQQQYVTEFAVAEAEKSHAEKQSQEMADLIDQAKLESSRLHASLLDAEVTKIESKSRLGAMRTDFAREVSKGGSPEKFNKTQISVSSREPDSVLPKPEPLVDSQPAPKPQLTGSLPPKMSGKEFVLSRRCNLYSEASADSAQLGKIQPGQRFPAGQVANGFVEYQSEQGKAYIRASCGKFE